MFVCNFTTAVELLLFVLTLWKTNANYGERDVAQS